MRRLDTGQWGGAGPEQLNTLAKSLHASDARFTRIDPYTQRKYQPDVVPRVSRLARVCGLSLLRSSGR